MYYKPFLRPEVELLTDEAKMDYRLDIKTSQDEFYYDRCWWFYFIIWGFDERVKHNTLDVYQVLVTLVDQYNGVTVLYKIRLD